MDIRQITLKNKNGIILNLNDTDHFFEQLSGFGFERKIDTESVGINFIEVENYIKQPKIKGNMKFSSYAFYNSFIRFSQFTPLIMSYTMPGIDETYYINIKAESIGKTEKENDLLVCPVEFLGYGHFYREVSAQNETGGTGKVYPYTYPYTYSDNSSGTVTIESDTTLESPVKITFFGECENPSWTHYADGVVVGNGKVNCTVGAGERLIIDTTSVPYSIKKFDSTLTEIDDCYQDSDFSTNRFVLLQLGENKIGFTHEGTGDLSVLVEGRLEYESV